jgi:hypothetical protein
MRVNRKAGLGLVLAAAAVTTACQPTFFQYTATTYGSSATAAGVINSGPTFLAQFGCTVKPGLVVTNSGAGADLTPLGTVGAVQGRVTTGAAGAVVSSNAQEKVGAVNLLGGAVTADAIHITSITTHDATGFHVQGQTQFANLKVNGTPVTATVRPNTKITIPNVGSVTLNEQVRTGAYNAAGYRVLALQVVTNTANVQNFPVGANVIVGAAASGLDGAVIGRLGGTAYATNLKAGPATSGSSAPASVPCRGTDGKTLTNSTAAVSIPGIGTIGAATDSSRGTLNSTSALAETVSKIAGTNLLSSVVSASAIQAAAHTSLDGKTHIYSDTGSKFVGLAVQGFPGINDNVKPNTTVTIPGIGTLYLHRIIRSGNSIEVRMVELVLTQARGGLPIGADIKIGVASANIV